MYFHTVALIFQMLVTFVLAIPAQPLLDNLFTSSDIPLIDSLPSVFNYTEDASPLPKRALRLNYVLYRITMNGLGQGGWPAFRVTGDLLITSGIPSSGTQNGANNRDVLISIGSPAVFPVAGAIRYASNRRLYRFIGGNNANAALDYAYVSTGPNSIKLTVDSRIAAANQLSNFNARSGLTAQVYIIASGGMSFSLGTKAVSGWVSLVGRGFISPGFAPYRALVTGVPVGRGTTLV